MAKKPAQPKANVPAPRDPEPAGNFGLNETGDDWEWSTYIHTNATPSKAQYEFEARIGRIAESLRELGKSDETKPIMEQLKSLFSAALVQRKPDDLTPFSSQLDQIEARTCRTVARPKLREAIFQSLGLSAVFMVLAILAGQYAPAVLADVNVNLGKAWAFGLVVGGTFLGRALFHAMSYTSDLTDLGQYHKMQSQLGNPWVGILIDIIIGLAACVAFMSGFIIIAIGASADAPSSGLNSLSVNDNAMSAFVFGMIVGVARSQFMARVRGASEAAMK